MDLALNLYPNLCRNLRRERDDDKDQGKDKGLDLALNLYPNLCLNLLVDDTGDDYGLRVKRAASFSVVVAGVVDRNDREKIAGFRVCGGILC